VSVGGDERGEGGVRVKRDPGWGAERGAWKEGGARGVGGGVREGW